MKEINNDNLVNGYNEILQSIIPYFVSGKGLQYGKQGTGVLHRLHVLAAEEVVDKLDHTFLYAQHKQQLLKLFYNATLARDLHGKLK